MNPTVCGHVDARQMPASPFGKIVAFGYEDGPISGMIRCEKCDESYLFEMLASDIDGVHDAASWDRGEELRVYALAPLPAGTFERVVEILSAAETPSWPIWVPGALTRSARTADLLSNDIATIIRSIGPWLYVVVTSSLLQPSVAVRDAPPVDDLRAMDWFALFGFAAKERLLASS